MPDTTEKEANMQEETAIQAVSAMPEDTMASGETASADFAKRGSCHPADCAGTVHRPDYGAGDAVGGAGGGSPCAEGFHVRVRLLSTHARRGLRSRIA